MAEDYGYREFKDPKDLEEWFYNYEAKQRRARFEGHMSILKELYSNAISDLVYDQNPLLAKIPNNE